MSPNELARSRIRQRNRQLARAFAAEHAGPEPAVCMFVRNLFEHDARVTREAEALVDQGLRVVVFALARDPESIGVRVQGRLVVVRIYHATSPVRAVLRGLQFLQLASWKAARGISAAVRAPALVLGRAGSAAARRVWDRRVTRADPPRGTRLLQTFTRRVSLSLRPLDRLWNNVYFCRVSAAMAASIRPVAYHCHDGNTILGGLLAKRRHRARVVYDAHELWPHRNRPDAGRFKTWLAERADAAMSQRADAVITVNGSIARHMERRYRLPRVDVVMNTPETRPFAPLDDAQTFQMPRPRLIYSGFLTASRGIEEAVRALAELPECRLVVMGPDRSGYRTGLERLAAGLGVGDRLHVVPPVPHEQVPAAASQADVALVLFRDTCLSYRYTLPNKLFEALHAGLAVVASDLPELRTVVTTWDCGAVCDPDDPSSIAAAVRSVLADENRLAEMRGNARRAAAEFAWENEEPKLIEIYRRLGCINHSPVRHARTG